MNRDALVARAETRYRDTGNVVTTVEEWVDYVNDAYLDAVAARPDWPFLETRTTNLSVTAGTGTVALPADAWRVTAVYDATNKSTLLPMDGRRHFSMFPDPVSALGVPEFYRLRGSNLDVYPWVQVATTLNIDTYVPPSALGPTDEPVFPEQYHRMLVSGALSYAYEDDGNPQQAALHRQTFDRLLGVMALDLLGPRTEKFPEIVDTF